MPYFNVDATYTLQFSIHIEAKSEQEAEIKVRERINEHLGIGRCNSTPRGCWDSRVNADALMAFRISEKDARL